MLILLSNDDGINAPGIKAMQKELATIGEVVVVAPVGEQSAVGHAITIVDPLRVDEVYENDRLFGYSVNGTPADCVKIGIKALMRRTPDVVVSGINLGANVATNIIYSGTVSGATEGTVLGVPSVAISLNTFVNPDFGYAAKRSLAIVQSVVKNGLPPGTLLNVNFPAIDAEKIKGPKLCRQSDKTFQVRFDKREDLRGMPYYWQGGEMDYSETDPETDLHALEDGYITVTPIQFDLTNHRFLNEMKEWEL